MYNTLNYYYTIIIMTVRCKNIVNLLVGGPVVGVEGI